jgi:ribosomal protein S18 acetylase RimI-like enzyme
MLQSFSIRPAETHYIEEIADLGSKTYSLTFGHSVPASDLQAYLESSYSVASIAQDLGNALIDIIVACDDSNGKVVGFAQLTQGTTEPCLEGLEGLVELQRLYVGKTHHGRGIGKALVNEAERISREKGFRTMWLGVWEENFKAQAFYKSFGFVHVGEHDFVSGTCVQTDWIMTKKF